MNTSEPSRTRRRKRQSNPLNVKFLMSAKRSDFDDAFDEEKYKIFGDTPIGTEWQLLRYPNMDPVWLLDHLRGERDIDLRLAADVRAFPAKRIFKLTPDIVAVMAPDSESGDDEAELFGTLKCWLAQRNNHGRLRWALKRERKTASPPGAAP